MQTNKKSTQLIESQKIFSGKKGGGSQCDQIGRFLQVLDNKLSHKSSPNIQLPFWIFLIMSHYIKSVWLLLVAFQREIRQLFIPSSGHTDGSHEFDISNKSNNFFQSTKTTSKNMFFLKKVCSAGPNFPSKRHFSFTLILPYSQHCLHQKKPEVRIGSILSCTIGSACKCFSFLNAKLSKMVKIENYADAMKRRK